MRWTTVRLEEVAVTPWLNGGGVTRELLAWPHPQDWTVRFSVAEVTRDGPFSSLPGVRRWFAVVVGNGVRLRVDGTPRELTAQSPPLEFDGAAQTECELLDGPTRDFNLMLRQGRGAMDRVAAPQSRHCRSRTLIAIYAAAAGARLLCGGEVLDLHSHSLAWRILDSDELVEVTGGELLWMEIEP